MIRLQIVAYPTTLAAKIPWHSTFNQECIDTAATFSTILDAPTLAHILANKNFVATLINASDDAKNFGQEVVTFRDIYLGAALGTTVPGVPVPPAVIVVGLNIVVGIDAYTKLLIGQLNAHPLMTDAIRVAMGIQSDTPGLGTVRIIKGSPQGGSQVLLKIGLARYPAVAVYRKRGGTTEKIGVSISSDFIDTDAPLVAGQSESREYWVRGIVNNAETGPISATVLVATTPVKANAAAALAVVIFVGAIVFMVLEWPGPSIACLWGGVWCLALQKLPESARRRMMFPMTLFVLAVFAFIGLGVGIIYLFYRLLR